MVQGLTVLVKDLGSVPSTHMTVQTISKFKRTQYPPLASACTAHI